MTFEQLKKAIPRIKRKMQGWPYKVIVVDGPQGPTGKTTAAKLLREQGLTVYEDWEVLHVTLDALLPEWQEQGAHKEVNTMDNNKKPSEPVEEERWALKDVPTSQLVEELVSRTGVTAESSWWCRMSSYHIIIRINLNKEDCPQCLR